MTITPKIYLLLCSTLPGVNDQASFSTWCARLVEWQVLAKIEPIFLSGDNSAERTPADWSTIAQVIHQHQGPGVGFVILHGLDNILSASTLTAFAVAGGQSPVIFTGGDALTDDQLEASLRSILVNSIQIGTFAFNDVCLLFGNRLLRAALATPDASPNIFDTPEHGILGRVDFSVRLFPTITTNLPKKAGPLITPQGHFSVVVAHPFLTSADVVTAADSAGVVVVQAGKYHTVPTPLLDLLRTAKVSMPIIIWAPLDSTDRSDGNLVHIRQLTWDSLLAKLSCLPNIHITPEALKKVLEKNTIGELLHP
jgi:L-asparaginase/Glu-tRNA(Gln) amidotransferase subunit D